MFDFPTLKAWRNALLLFIPTYGASIVVFIFGFWLFFLIFCILLPWYDTALLFFLGIALIALVVALIGYLLVNFLYSLLLGLLWDNPPKWLRPPQSLTQNLAHLGVAIAATFPIAVIYVVHLLWIGHIEALTTVDYKAIYAPDLMLKLSWLWFITAAYLYHWKYQLSHKRNQKYK
ncbi:MAG: hypothetical protein AAGE84_05100 [Cyanobacteria bacterium P01_G01_bin.39]